MNVKLLVILILSMAAGLIAATTAPSEADQSLAEKGLKKFGVYYLLDVDANLEEELRAIRAAQAQLDAYTRKRKAMEADIARAEQVMDGLENDIQTIDGRMKGLRDAEAHNQLVEQHNQVVQKEHEGEKYIAQRRDDLSKLSTPTDYMTTTLSLADKMDQAVAQYSAFGNDKDVTDAIAAINAQSPTKYRLGPSARFKSELSEIHKQAAAIGAASVRFQMLGGVAQIPVILNDNVVVPMIVDSGASLVTITAEYAAKLNLLPRPTDQHVTLVIANGKKVDASVTTLSTIRVGQYVVKDVRCAILPANTTGADCLLGGSFLQNFVYQMDLAGGVLRLSPVSPQTTIASDSHSPATPGNVDATTKPTSTVSTSTTQPKESAQRITLQIDAIVDGSDQITINANGLTWLHKSDAFPRQVSVNGLTWNPKKQPNLALTNDLAFLQRADFASARVVDRQGRGTLLMENGQDGPTVFFSDPGHGADRYSITIAFNPK